MKIENLDYNNRGKKNQKVARIAIFRTDIPVIIFVIIDPIKIRMINGLTASFWYFTFKIHKSFQYAFVPFVNISKLRFSPLECFNRLSQKKKIYWTFFSQTEDFFFYPKFSLRCVFLNLRASFQGNMRFSFFTPMTQQSQ